MFLKVGGGGKSMWDRSRIILHKEALQQDILNIKKKKMAMKQSIKCSLSGQADQSPAESSEAEAMPCWVPRLSHVNIKPSSNSAHQLRQSPNCIRAN